MITHIVYLSVVALILAYSIQQRSRVKLWKTRAEEEAEKVANRFAFVRNALAENPVTVTDSRNAHTYDNCSLYIQPLDLEYGDQQVELGVSNKEGRIFEVRIKHRRKLWAHAVPHLPANNEPIVVRAYTPPWK